MITKQLREFEQIVQSKINCTLKEETGVDI